jgi:hypothetical protein
MFCGPRFCHFQNRLAAGILIKKKPASESLNFLGEIFLKSTENQEKFPNNYNIIKVALQSKYLLSKWQLQSGSQI